MTAYINGEDLRKKFSLIKNLTTALWEEIAKNYKNYKLIKKLF
ncbi:hypothetical protein NEOC65_001349 [Neochlamydia sp. AcF65]|nr:hypothetical protein [Neochlamydia sp. AcF65]MBS4170130.1 hypothetical protein [Neochlamydia sp. AcF95]